MTDKPIVVSPTITIEAGAKIMLKEQVGNLIIADSGVLKGIITEKDFVDRVVAKGIDPKKTEISKVMTPRLAATITPDKDILEAMKLMNDNKIRRLPVVDKAGKLIGVITTKDIIKVQPEMINLRLEFYDVKNENLKSNKFLEGECDECGNFTLVERSGNKVLCSECRNKKYY